MELLLKQVEFENMVMTMVIGIRGKNTCSVAMVAAVDLILMGLDAMLEPEEPVGVAMEG